MANSRFRAADRASRRLATFAQAISKTSPTAPNSSRSVSPDVPNDVLLERLDINSQISVGVGIEPIKSFWIVLISA